VTDNQVYAGALLVGAAAGLRSMSAPAMVGQWARPRSVGSGLAKTMVVFAVAEVIADKLPFMPNRTEPFSVAWRAIAGGTSGALLCSSKKRSPLFGAILGSLAALGTTYAGFELRRRAAKDLHVPDAVIAVAEDALVATSGWLVMSQLQPAIESA